MKIKKIIMGLFSKKTIENKIEEVVEIEKIVVKKCATCLSAKRYDDSYGRFCKKFGINVSAYGICKNNNQQ